MVGKTDVALVYSKGHKLTLEAYDLVSFGRVLAVWGDTAVSGFSTSQESLATALKDCISGNPMERVWKLLEAKYDMSCVPAT